MGGTSPGVTAVWSAQTGELLYTLQLPLSSAPVPHVSSPASDMTQHQGSSYLKPTIPSMPPSYPLTSPSEAVFSCPSHLSIVKQYRRSEIIQCSSDRLSGLVATLTDSAVVLWK